jgi:hypothetical protein
LRGFNDVSAIKIEFELSRTLAWWLSSRQANTGSPEFEEAPMPVHVRMNIIGGNSAVKSGWIDGTFLVHSNRRFEFQKRRQLFIRAHNEALTVAAMCA